MATQRIKMIEVYPDHQERRFLVESAALQPVNPDGTIGQSWSSLVGKPSTFPPTAHDHPELEELIWFLSEP